MLFLLVQVLSRQSKSVIRKIDLASIPRRPVPRALAVQNVGSAANWVQGAAHEIDNEMIAGGAFDRPVNLFIENILGQEPQSPADRRRNQIDLSHASQTVLVTGKTA